FVVFANDDSWTSLSRADRELVLQASARARTGMRAALLGREQLAVAGLCRTGARLIDLGPDGQARMRAAGEALLAKLRRDPATRDTMAEIAAARTGSSPHGLRCPASAGATQPAGLTGSYETTIRKTEKGSGALAEDWASSGTDTLRLRLRFANGRAV